MSTCSGCDYVCVYPSKASLKESCLIMRKQNDPVGEGMSREDNAMNRGQKGK
jgi:hypothetical protein